MGTDMGMGKKRHAGYIGPPDVAGGGVNAQTGGGLGMFFNRGRKPFPVPNPIPGMDGGPVLDFAGSGSVNRKRPPGYIGPPASEDDYVKKKDFRGPPDYIKDPRYIGPPDYIGPRRFSANPHRARLETGPGRLLSILRLILGG
jgi:hypothetical protein